MELLTYKPNHICLSKNSTYKTAWSGIRITKQSQQQQRHDIMASYNNINLW